MVARRTTRAARSSRGSSRRGGDDRAFNISRSTKPARKWVEVARPPATGVGFAIDVWVPIEKLTEEERLRLFPPSKEVTNGQEKDQGAPTKEPDSSEQQQPSPSDVDGSADGIEKKEEPISGKPTTATTQDASTSDTVEIQGKQDSTVVAETPETAQPALSFSAVPSAVTVETPSTTEAARTDPQLTSLEGTPEPPAKRQKLEEISDTVETPATPEAAAVEQPPAKLQKTDEAPETAETAAVEAEDASQSMSPEGTSEPPPKRAKLEESSEKEASPQARPIDEMQAL